MQEGWASSSLSPDKTHSVPIVIKSYKDGLFG